MRGAEFSELAAFVAVAEERSFRRAAVRLALSPSALSHTIRALEDRLGVRLLNRTTRSVATTEAGRDLLDRLAPAFADILGAVQAAGARSARPSGTVRLNVSRMVAHMALVPAFGRFARAYPEVSLDVTVDDGLVDIVAGGFDAGIRLGGIVQRDMVAARVTPDLRIALVASPGYLAVRPAPCVPHDLRGHACINYRWAGSGALHRWAFERGAEALDIVVEGPLTINDPDLIVAAALDGVGLAYTLESRVAGHLAAGRLVRVLEDWCPPFPGFFLYYPGRRHRPPALAALVDFLRMGEG